jgi:ribonuclease III
VTDLVVVFRTQSDVEASIVRGLLESHGVPIVVSSALPHSVFPLSVNTLGEVRISVHPDDAEEARRIIESHRTTGVSGQVVRIRDEFETLQQAIGYRFRDRGLLEHAMTHTSRANEDVSGGVVDNESLEFLGDAVLGFVVADLLFRELPESDEGLKSKSKAALVSTAALARLAERLRLGEYLLLGRGEEKTGGRKKPALLADAYEALIAAIYLDGGIEQARSFLAREMADLVADLKSRGAVAGQDDKSALQEWLQSQNRPLPEYRIVGALGPDHNRLFEVEIVASGETIGRGSGTTKKEAEQAAARSALERLRA